ncbi:hypothetical protein JCM11251_002773 [Rhodosporidiobolus azoricus]
MKFGLLDASSSSEADSEVDDLTSPLPKAPSPRRIRKTPTRSLAASTSRLTSSNAPSGSSNNKPFDPTPVSLPRPPALSRSKAAKRRRRPLFTSGSEPSDASSSGEEGEDGEAGMTSESELGEEDGASESDEDFDSEEEEWPVGPVGSIGMGGWRRSRVAKGKRRAAPTPGKVFGGMEEHEVWEEKSRAESWAAANRTFHLSLSRAKSSSPSLLKPPASSSSFSSSTTSPGDLSSISTLLSQLDLRQRTETAALVASFEARNKSLWSSIEAAIEAAEKEEGERQRALAEKRKKEEEQERKAKEMREEAERKAKEEKEIREKEEKERLEKEKEEEKKREEEKAKRAEEEREKAAKASAVGLPAAGAEGSPEREFERWTAKMTYIKQSVLPVVSQNPAWRKACFQAKRSITPKIGQLTSSAEATLRIITQLDELLSSLKPDPANPAARPAEPYTWTLNHLAKSLVKQAETEVTAKLGTAYPLGRVVIGLLTRGHTDLGEVLMARLVKKCFWLTGWWPRKAEGQSDESYQKTLGHAPPTSSESLVQYATRMSGLVALYASILSTSPLSHPQGPCPPDRVANVPPWFRASAGWRWLVLMLRPPLVGLEPTPLLLVTFLEISGQTLLELYGRQFAKLLEVLLREGIRGEQQSVWSEKAKSTRVRLGLWLEDWERGKMEVVQGREVDP